MQAESLHRVDERPPSVGPKRLRDWEDESASKKQANEENRARLEDLRHRRPSTPPRESYRRSSSEARRLEEQRRAEEQRHGNEGYHPSEAAHHQAPPSHLPPMQQGPAPMQGVVHEGAAPQPAGPAAPPSEERQALEHPTSATRAAPPPSALNEPERAARKVDVNENYDDEEEDEKKGHGANGAAPSSTSDTKSGTPTNGGVNGVIGPTPKVESS